MCGFVGYLCSSGHGSGVALGLRKGLQLLAHRGPDDSGFFEEESEGIGIAHARLAIQDLTHLGHQPMQSQDDMVALAFNGEIYNFRELRTELISQGIMFKGCSDTEVLLNLYLLEGEKMLQRLNGVFAFALWDGRNQSLFVARDGLGVKPLYYAALESCFLFASEIKALLPMLPDESELDSSALQRYLTFLWCPGEGTPLSSVRKLLPGELMFVSSGEIVQRRRWYQLPVFRSPAQSLLTKEAVAVGVREKLRAAVHRQMVSDIPVGAFLSGGLDSSAIVAFAREQDPDIRCFTIESNVRESGVVDDLPYAQRVARHLGVPLDVIRIDPVRMADGLEEMVYQLDEPLADPAPLNVLYISQFAKEHGIKVLLSGAGGDDLFTGYRRHQALMAEHWWSWLPLPARRGLGWIVGRSDQRNAVGRRLAKLFSGASLDGDERLVNYFRWAARDDLERLYSSAFREALNDTVAEAPMIELLNRLPENTSRLERMMSLEQSFFLADHNLLYTDKMSMAAGVEVRVPFLDLDLVDYAAQIPAQFKQRGKEGKWALKKAMEPYLPRDVIYRPKTGFGAPLRSWMRNELRELLGDFLSVESLSRRGLFNPIAVQNLISDNDHGRVDASYTLLSLLCIEIWCRKFIDTKTITTI